MSHDAVHVFSYLWGSAEQQAPWVRHKWSLVVGVMLPGDGPLAVVQALLCPLLVVSDRRPEGAAPGHVRMRQQGEGAQLTPRLPRQQVVRRSRQDDRPGRHPSGLGVLVALRGLAGPLGGGGGRGGRGGRGAGVKGGRGLGGFGGVGAKLGVALLLENLCPGARVGDGGGFRGAAGG